MRRIGQQFSIEGRDGERISVYVPQAQQDILRLLVPQAMLIQEDVDAWMRDLSEEDKAGYKSYKQYQELFADYAQQHPKLARVEQMDWMKTRNGKTILVLKATRDVGKEHPLRPNVVITASTHGDEWSSTAAAMGVLDAMLAAYGKDPRITRILNRVNTYWVPSMSPDSYHVSRNVHGVDPNRVYPYPGRDTAPRIQSARAFLKWYDTLKPKGVIDFHGFHGSIIWPWGYTRKSMPRADVQRYTTIVEKMIAKTGYRHGQVTKVLYDAPGISIDAWYQRYGTVAYTIEVAGSSKKPTASALPKLIKDNTEHVLTFFEAFIEGEDPEEEENSPESSPEDEASPDESESGESGDSSADSSGKENPSEQPSEDPDDPSEQPSDESEGPSASPDQSPESSPKDGESGESPQASANKEPTGSGGCRLAPKGAPLGLLALGSLLFFRRKGRRIRGG